MVGDVGTNQKSKECVKIIRNIYLKNKRTKKLTRQLTIQTYWKGWFFLEIANKAVKDNQNKRVLSTVKRQEKRSHIKKHKFYQEIIKSKVFWELNAKNRKWSIWC